MKTLFTTLIFAASFTVAKAQDFTLQADTMRKDTTGSVIIEPCEQRSVIFYNYVRNNTTAALPPFHWKIILKDFPIGWFLCQFCENNTCNGGRNPDGSVAAWAKSPYIEIVAGEIQLNDSSLLEPAITVPADADNGVGILRVRVWTDNTTDTATFIINKTPLGISKIAVNDSRVNIYPNPADNTILVYAERSVNATSLSIISVTGHTVDRRTLKGNKEVSNINISALSKGTYMIRLTDDKGQLITSRKFIKE